MKPMDDMKAGVMVRVADGTGGRAMEDCQQGWVLTHMGTVLLHNLFVRLEVRSGLKG